MSFSANITVKEISDHLKHDILQGIINELLNHDQKGAITFEKLTDLLIDAREKV